MSRYVFVSMHIAGPADVILAILLENTLSFTKGEPYKALKESLNHKALKESLIKRFRTL